MDSDPLLDDLVAPLRADVTSGASVLARTAADVVRRAAIRIRAGSLDEFRWSLGEVATKILDAQPAMASLVALVREVMVDVEATDSVEHGRHAAASAADRFRGSLDGRLAAVATAAAPVLPVGGTIATISSSATVHRLLREEAVPRGLTVLCFESRPVKEGRTLAAELAGAGVDVTYAVDAAAHRLVPACEAVFIGADSVGDAGVVNKIGSAVVAHSARAASIPVYVLADDTKILPRGFPQILDDDRPTSEVWRAPDGVRVWNSYFEVVPLDYVSAIVTEAGVERPDDLERRRADMPLPAGLRAWARSRGRPPTEA